MLLLDAARVALLDPILSPGPLRSLPDAGSVLRLQWRNVDRISLFLTCFADKHDKR